MDVQRCTPASSLLLEGPHDVLGRTLVSLGELEPIFVDRNRQLYFYSLRKTFNPLDLEIGMRKSNGANKTTPHRYVREMCTF